MTLTFAIWWKFVLLLFAFGLVETLAGAVLPRGQLEYWLAMKIVQTPFVGNVLASVPGLLSTVMSALADMLRGLILFALLYALMRLHIGRRFGGVVLAWQAPANGPATPAPDNC